MTNSRMLPTILIGAGMHGRVVRDLCRDAGLDVAGFLDDFTPAGTMVDDCVVLGATSRLNEQDLIAAHRFIVCIGNNFARQNFGATIRQRGGQFAIAIHPNCVVSPTARVSDGTVLIGANMVFSRAQIGEHVLIDPDVTVGADSKIGNGVYIAPGVHLGAGVEIAANAFIGLGAVVLPELQIGEGAIVGAGAVVTRDVPRETLVVGSPAIAKGKAVMDAFSPYPARARRK